MAALSAGLALAPPPAAANPLDAFGFGARAMGLAGAGTALADDFSANYYNPAALAAIDGLSLDLGYTFTAPRLTLNGADLDVDQSRGFQGGLVVPGTLFGRRVAASVGLHLPDRLVSRIRSLPQQQPRFVLYDNRPQRIVISTSLAVEVMKDLYLGAGLTFLANTRGKLDIAGEVSITDAERTTLLSAVDVDLQAVRYPTFGALFTPGRHWRIGLAWREEFNLRLDIDVDVHGDIMADFDPDNPVVLLEDGRFLLQSGNTNLFSPRQVALGIAHQRDAWTAAVDVTWQQWSRFPAPTATVAIDLDLGELPFQVPPIDPPEAPGFNDIVVLRAAGEWSAIDTPGFGLKLRGGYSFEPSPAPDQPGATNYVDGDKHGAALGATLRVPMAPVLPKPLEIDLAVQHHWLVERAYYKDDPADPVGDYRAGGRMVGASATTRLRF